MPLRGSYDVTAMCLRARGLRFFSNLSLCGVKQSVEATMPENPYNDCKVSLQLLHGNDDLNILRASYTRPKANVTEALSLLYILVIS